MSMGWAEAERQEHQEQMLENDLKAGHKPGCLISYPPPDGGYCNCGLYERGVSQYDPINFLAVEGRIVGWSMYFYGFLSGIGTLIILLAIMEWVGVL